MPPGDAPLVPDPPPPRPARRDAAIDAAMRRFDGAEDPPRTASDKPRRSWAGRPQLAWAMTAGLVAIIGLPTAFLVMRDGNSPIFQASPPSSGGAEAHREDMTQNVVAVATPSPEPSAPPAKPPVTSVIPARPQSDARVPAAKQADELAAAETPVMEYAAPPPPPPPPPPPVAPMVAQKSVGGVASNDVVVTGSRIPQPNPQREEGRVASAQRADVEDSLPVSGLSKDTSYATFLKHLQGAVRANDRGAVIKLVGFPLRVNSNGKTRVYRDAASVRADYDQIFTLQVRQAILAQRHDRLFSRDQGLMIGNGQVWFDHICTNAQCSPPGPVRITAVNR